MELLILCLIMILVFFSCVGIKEMLGGSGLDSGFFIILMFICSSIILVLHLICLNKPQAMDVYKGRTTLEITYKNRMPIDSTVVWKNK